MSERYIITGAQLGLFEIFSKDNKPKEIKKLIEEIIDKQFVGHSGMLIDKEAQKLSKDYPGTKDKLYEKPEGKMKKYLDEITEHCMTAKEIMKHYKIPDADTSIKFIDLDFIKDIFEQIEKKVK